jgi:enterobactin synthetase component D
MPSRAVDFAIEPSGAVRCAIDADLYDESVDLTTCFAGVALPATLHSAVRKRQYEYLAGRWCARRALATLAPSLAQWELAAGDDRAPSWPEACVGAITHTQGYVAAVVGLSRDFVGIGCDTEQRFDLERARRIASHFARPQELSSLVAHAPLDEADLATLVFSAKESVYKCLYPSVKRFFGFQCAEVIEVTHSAFVVRLVETLSASQRAGVLLHGRYVRTDLHMHTSIAIAR